MRKGRIFTRIKVDSTLPPLPFLTVAQLTWLKADNGMPNPAFAERLIQHRV